VKAAAKQGKGEVGGKLGSATGKESQGFVLLASLAILGGQTGRGLVVILGSCPNSKRRQN